MSSTNAGETMTASLPHLCLYSAHETNVQVTPHKISILILINEYLSLISKDKTLLTSTQRRDFAMLLLNILQCPDVSLEKLLSQVVETVDQNLSIAFKNSVEQIYVQGIGKLMDTIQTAHGLLSDSSALVHKSSVVGFFIRRMYLSFEKMYFSQITKLCKAFNKYYKMHKSHQVTLDCTETSIADLGNDLDESEISIHIEKPEEISDRISSVFRSGMYSQKQAEYFIAQQSILLQRNEIQALSAKELQSRLGMLLKSNPELAEAHFLSYLNSLRLHDYCLAVDSLHHYFDRCSLNSYDTKTSREEAGRSFRYAALNLTALHYRFGHRQEALAAVNEAIRMAQESNDNVCLQHALGWLYKIQQTTSRDVEDLMHRSICKAGELGLSYLVSVGIQSFTRHKALMKVSPANTFEFLVKSDILNCQDSHLDLLATSYAQKAALWDMYGNSSMMSLCSQTLLHLNLSDPSKQNVYYNGEAVCIALCNMASFYAKLGDTHTSLEILSHVRQNFPTYSNHAHLWMECEQIIKFHKCLLQSEFQAAEQHANNLAALNLPESSLKKALLYIAVGRQPEAYDLLQVLKEQCSEYNRMQSSEYSSDFHARVLMTICQYYCQIGIAEQAITYLTEAIVICREHYKHYMEALVTLHLANVQFLMNMPNQAQRLIESKIINILAGNSTMDKACARYLYAKCLVKATNKNQRQERHKALSVATSLLTGAIAGFKMMQAFRYLKDALYFQALVKNELGCTEERNDCALKFKKLNQQYPTFSMHRSQIIGSLL